MTVTRGNHHHQLSLRVVPGPSIGGARHGLKVASVAGHHDQRGPVGPLALSYRDRGIAQSAPNLGGLDGMEGGRSDQRRVGEDLVPEPPFAREPVGGMRSGVGPAVSANQLDHPRQGVGAGEVAMEHGRGFLVEAPHTDLQFRFAISVQLDPGHFEPPPLTADHAVFDHYLQPGLAQQQLKFSRLGWWDLGGGKGIGLDRDQLAPAAAPARLDPPDSGRRIELWRLPGPDPQMAVGPRFGHHMDLGPGGWLAWLLALLLVEHPLRPGDSRADPR